MSPPTIIWACPLIFLAKRFNTPYYRVLMIPGTSGHELVRQVDVLSRAVEISVDGPGLRKFTPYFLYAALNRGVFCFGAISPAQKQRHATGFNRIS